MGFCAGRGMCDNPFLNVLVEGQTRFLLNNTRLPCLKLPVQWAGSSERNRRIIVGSKGPGCHWIISILTILLKFGECAIFFCLVFL